ncbi:MAG: dTDP-glucose 4,6-dehydratase [Pseudomonadota bacterium]
MTIRRLLITGGAGFIGCNFVHYWMKHHPQDRVVVLDALAYAGNLANLEPVKDNPNFRFVHGNICDQPLVEKLLTEEQLDTIVHFAAESHVDRSILAPDAFIETNVIGTYSLLKAAKKVWLDTQHSARRTHRFHHVSTDEVYGSLGPNDPPFTETTPYAPNSPYAASKAASDHLVRAYHHTYGLNVTTSNCSNNYGPYHFPEKLIPLTLTNIMQRKPVPIYGDGLNIRDWLYVEDHCRGIELLLEKGKVGETYNIGGNNEWTNIDIVKLICKIMDEHLFVGTQNSVLGSQRSGSDISSSELITFVKDRPGHDRRYAIDAEKIGRELGYRPRESFESGIRRTIAWYLENEPWWRGIMDGSYLRWIDLQYGKAG